MFYIGSLLKNCLIGGGVGICVAAPSLFHLKSFNDFYEIVDISKISETDPILDCNQHNRHYRVYLTAKEEGNWNEENSKDSITLSVFDVKENSLSWGGTKRAQDEQWNNWKIRLDERKQIYLQVPYVNKSFAENDYQSLLCQKSKILSTLSDSGREVNVTATKYAGNDNAIGFKLQENSACKKSEKRTECEISFNEDNNLNWVSDFKPKAYFYS